MQGGYYGTKRPSWHNGMFGTLIHDDIIKNGIFGRLIHDYMFRNDTENQHGII